MNRMTGDDIHVQKLPLGAYQANCYIVSDPDSRDAMLIDVPGVAGDILREVGNLKVSVIVLTHTHFDHVEALEGLRSRLGADLGVHVAESDRVIPPPDRVLEDGDNLTVGRFIVQVMHTPGHTPGSICLVCGGHLFAGDTLFPGGPGKTAKPDDFKTIRDSIRTRLLILPDDLIVHPGHGPDTTLGKEKREFALFSSRSHRPDLHGDVLWLTS